MYELHPDRTRELTRRACALGYAGVPEMAADRPLCSLIALAGMLGEHIAAVEVEKLLRAEAISTDTFNRFARALLVRRLHQELHPDGWGQADDAEIAGVFAIWETGLHDHDHDLYERQTDAVWAALRKHAPTGWIPSSADDPIIEAAFKKIAFPPNK